MPNSHAKNNEKHGVADTIRLTDAEREAIETAIATLDAFRYPTLPAAAATLRKLMERTQ